MRLRPSVLALAACAAMAAAGCAPQAETPGETPATPAPPQFKMTTEVPDNVLIPPEVDTRLGTLKFFDGVPTEETAAKVWDQLDFQRAVECMILTTPAASLSGFRRGIREFGPDNETAIIWEDRLDSKALLLTGNTSVIYLFMWLDTKNGPVVLETPPNILAIVDDFWFHYVTDIGNAGPDRGQGGKYLILPPDFDGEVPAGYFASKSNTYGNWFVIRGFPTGDDNASVVKNIKDNLKVYPLAEKSNPKPVQYYNISNKYLNTLHAQDITFFHEVNEVVQEEHNEAFSPEVLGMLASIGIEKGKEFKPDARMTKILSEAAVVGTAAQRSIIWRNRSDTVKIWPDSKSWEIGFAGGSHAFDRDGVRLINERTRFHYYATGITPVMVKPPVGAGSQYVIGLRDSEGGILDGSNTYKLHIPANVPAKRFWEVTVYDNQTRSMLQTDQRLPGITSIQSGVVQNDDGSYDIFFGPEKPEGQVNWIQTIPNKGWNVLWRIYSPTQVWYDKAWRQGEIERVK
ncbi:MAG: DUF1254 domain-containing protein [Acidobacteriota bacterium]